MPKPLVVVSVGAIVRGLGPDELRERLRAWPQEGDRETIPDKELEAQVAQSAEQHLSFRWSMFAQLRDGRRVVELETHRGMDLGRSPVVLLEPGEPRPSEEDLLPNQAAVEETLRRSIERESPKDRWQEVLALLKREGLKTSARELDKLPFDFEFDARAEELASGGQGPEDYPFSRVP